MRRIKLARFLMKICSLLPEKFTVKSSVPIPSPIFIFGSGRNGSTLFNRMLNQHPELFAPSEQYFLGPTIIKFHLYRHLLNWRDLVKIITGELNQSSGSHTWETGYGPQLIDLFKSENKSLQFVIDNIYQSYGRSFKGDFSSWVDTTPFNTKYCQEIYQTFPDAHYFFLIRDGRDVVNSYLQGGKDHFGELADPTFSSHHWNDSIKSYNWLKARRKVNLIRYEELVSNPELILTKICNELGISFDPLMLEYHQEILPEGFKEDNHRNIRKPVFKDSIGRWKKNLDKDSLNKVMPIIKKNLKVFEYL